ncbi:MAG TPA: hypothetical protein VJP85_10505 [Candidatus Baltobacteraceae bacterium]|nr:hypothetical protein [Candidatus Baltobacteraceae bacterium]
MRRTALLLPLVLLAGCAAPPPAIKEIGVFPPGATIVARNIHGNIDAYAPERGQPPDQYTVAAYGPPGSVSIKKANLLVAATATRPGVNFLLRGPKGGAMDISTQQGDIHVGDFEGVVNAHTDRGNIAMLIPQYGSASIGTGNMSVIFASTNWPGTLTFTIGSGNVELYVNEHAQARIRLHTDNGTLFTDFPPQTLKGRSHGTNETLEGTINGGGPRSIDVEVRSGIIRVLQLKPQI